jgi:hypothetical protein
MKPSRRRVLASLVVVLAGLSALVVAGGHVAGCLGPIGVTQIQCAKAMGFIPTVGPGLPLCLLAVALGLLILYPIRAGRRRGATIAAGLAGGVVAAAFATAWERTWTGVDSAGRMLSIDRPLDLGAVAAVAILAATAGGLAWGRVVPPSRTRLAGRS